MFDEEIQGEIQQLAAVQTEDGCCRQTTVYNEHLSTHLTQKVTGKDARSYASMTIEVFTGTRSNRRFSSTTRFNRRVFRRVGLADCTPAMVKNHDKIPDADALSASGEVSPGTTR